MPLQKGVMGPENAQLLGALVVAELWQAIRERAGTPEGSRVPVMVYIDEVQEYLDCRQISATRWQWPAASAPVSIWRISIRSSCHRPWPMPSATTLVREFASAAGR